MLLVKPETDWREKSVRANNLKLNLNEKSKLT